MDAERLEFSDGSFDVVLSLYALLHFHEPLVALREMHRVLRPGGRIVIGVGRGPSLLSWNAVIEGVKRMRDLVGAATRTPSDRVQPRSLGVAAWCPEVYRGGLALRRRSNQSRQTCCSVSF